MAEVQAFRGFRYDLGRVGNLADVVAPPYDVIDTALQDSLYQKSPHNVVRLILNKETPQDNPNDNRYTRSARILRDWLQDGILVQDSARSLYVYHQEFEIEGQGRRHVRKGFMARVRLEPFPKAPSSPGKSRGENSKSPSPLGGESLNSPSPLGGEGRGEGEGGKIYPHEETLPGPKADRLKLFQATAMNLSQIFALFPDEEGAIQARLDAAIQRALPLQATDHLGVIHKLWAVTDQQVVSAVTGLMGPKPLFIADGHHRYETALRYLEERQQAGDVKSPDASANFVLMMLVSMHDPGLVILPTHRLVSGVGDLGADRVHSLLAKHFQVEKVGVGPEGARETWELLEAEGAQEVLGLGTVADGVWQIARFRSPELMAQTAPEHTPAWRGLAVSILHRAILDKLLPDAGLGKPTCQYVHLLREVTEAVANRQCQLAVLVPPVSMTHVAQIAGNLEKMPPKSTYFYPKVLSGLVFHSLK